jgi:KaiC/GvpD/RAD55 family RecA-like ATPase
MIDREQLYQWWKIFHDEGDLHEIRIHGIGSFNASGYFRDIDSIINAIQKYDAQENAQIYFVLNKINDECYNRAQKDKIVNYVKPTTSDADIVGRKWILIDFDPKRQTGTSSSKDELLKARDAARKTYDFLVDQGINPPVVAMSGNGYHLLVRVQLANTDENQALVSRFLKAISMMFQTEDIDIDLKVYNASRICKLYGTWAKKGANTEERPWRMAKLIKVPEEIVPNEKVYIEKIANLYKEEKPQPTRENNYGQGQIDVEAFLSKHGLEYRKTRTSSGTRYILKECPFGGSEHSDPDSMVFQYDNGAVEFFCFHNSCEQYHWRDLRLKYEPDAYDKKDYNEFKYKQRYYEKYRPVQEPAEIKAETEELGKKWLTARDIKIVRDSDRFSIKTGIYALDKAIGGLFDEQTTVLSGINASGKTAILNQLLLNAVQRDIPSALWSGELPAERIKAWLCQTAAGKNNVVKVEGRDNAYEAIDSVIPKIENWLDERLIIYNNNYGNNCEQILADVEEAIVKYNLKFIVLDNLMALSLEYLVGTMNEKQKALMLKLDEIAKKYHVHILIIAHPRKEATFQLLRKESISGTSDLTNICWNLLLLHRVNDDFEKRATEFWGKERTQRLIYEGYNNIIEVAKNRDYGVENFNVGLYYEPETKRFKNSRAENMHYDWEEGIEEYHKLPDAPPAVLQPNTNFDNQGPDDPYEAQFQHDSEPPF